MTIESLCVDWRTDAILTSLRDQKLQLARNLPDGNFHLQLGFGLQETACKSQRNPVMTAIEEECCILTEIFPIVKAIAESDSSAQCKSGDPLDETACQRDFPLWLSVGGDEEGRTQPDPFETGEGISPPTEPVEQEKSTGGMRKNPNRIARKFLQHLLQKKACFGNGRHISPHPVRFSIPRPVEPDRAITRPREQSRSPVMPSNVIAKTVKDERISPADSVGR